MTRYASDTSVPADRSRLEIEATLRRYGATEFASGWSERKAVIGFRISDLQIRFELQMPDPADPEFTHTPGRGQKRTQAAAQAAWEQATRQRWRALALVVKAKLPSLMAGGNLPALLPGGSQ